MLERPADGRYGRWPGNPEGKAEDTSRCAAQVNSGYLFHQCSRGRGHGPGGLYCKQHGTIIEGWHARRERGPVNMPERMSPDEIPIYNEFNDDH